MSVDLMRFGGQLATIFVASALLMRTTRARTEAAHQRE